MKPKRFPTFGLTPILVALGWAVVGDDGSAISGATLTIGAIGLLAWLGAMVGMSRKRDMPPLILVAWTAIASLVLFSALYAWSFSTNDPDDCFRAPQEEARNQKKECSFSEDLTKIDAIYFVFTTVATRAMETFIPCHKRPGFLLRASRR